MSRAVSLSNGTKFFAGIVAFAMLLPGPSHANIILGYNTDGSPIYGAEPPGATGPIATPENPTWIPNSDGTPTKAQQEYTFIPNADERANQSPEVVNTAPPGMIQLGFNTDGTPIYGPEPQGATGPIATPEHPSWIKNPDGTPTAAELEYTFIPNAEERAREANQALSQEQVDPAEAQLAAEKEITASRFTKTKQGKTFTLTSNVEISSTKPMIRVIAVKKGSPTRKISFTFTEEGQLVLKAPQKLKGFQIQIIGEDKVLKKITL